MAIPFIIHGTTPDYRDDKTWFTKSKDGNITYALFCVEESAALRAAIKWKTNIPKKGTKMTWVQTGETIKWQQEGDRVEVFLPKSLLKNKTSCPAIAFAFTGSNKQ